MNYLESTPESHKKTSRIRLSVTIAVVISLVVITDGIWNSYKTGLGAEQNIKSSLELQRLSDSLHFHQQNMNTAVELAVSNNEAHWEIAYVNSMTKMQNAISAIDIPFSQSVSTQLKREQAQVIAMERELFRLIAANKPGAAFTLLASEKYQDIKIKQEQDALTLRAALDAKAKDIINRLKKDLRRTTIILVLQIAMVLIVWISLIAFIRNWQMHQGKHSEELSRLAHYDPLTGIGNRTLFQTRLESAFQQSNRDGKPVGLILMDIDHFKDINDSLGHSVGDKLLANVAQELQQTCRETDTVVRLGGDEFAIIATNFDNKRDTAILCNKILSLFETPFQIQGAEINTATSIGLSFYPDDARSAEELLRKSDLALYEAKRNGRANFKFFDSSIETQAREKARIQADLQEALANDEFTLYYQPIINIADNRVVGVESLIRWQHPQRGMIPPDEFISIAEESRLIIPIGEWALKQACLQQIKWQENMPSINIAVNLSALQFNDPELISKIERIMKQTSIGYNALTLEITESTLMENEGDLIEKLHALKDLGLKLAIDDFGTGYSSLAYLKRFPIHHLKIDREFIKDLPDDSHDIAIARSIIKMAHELGIDVVAEGIETQSQLNFLKIASCNQGQGYHFGRPMPATDFEDWYRRFASKAPTNIRAIK